MWEILEVLRRVHAGEGRRSVARGTGQSRQAIARYIKRGRALGWEPGGPTEPDEALATRIAIALRPGPGTAPSGTSEIKLQQHLKQLRGWLDPPLGRPLTLAKVHILLRACTVIYVPVFVIAAGRA